MDHFYQIKDALQSLLGQPGEDKPFVIIDHPSGKFVQFTGSTSEPLLLDLPSQPLSEAEFYRAVAYFKRFGVVGADHEVFDPDGCSAGTQFAFNVTFDSAEKASAAALEIFELIYGLPKDAKLTIERSWGPRTDKSS